MSTRVRAISGAALLILAISACSGGSSSSGGDVASVNDQKISRADYDAKLEVTPQAKNILNQMVQSALIDQYAASNHVDVPDADVEKKIDEYRAKYGAQFEQILKQQNLTLDDVKKIVREQLVVQKAVSGGAKVTDADVKSYLDKNHATLDTQAQVKARHILVADLATANKVEAELKGGAKFEDEAKKYSTDPASKDKGGDLGFFSKGQMVPAFQDAAFSQAIGAVGPPVHSPFGYHIIQVEDKKPATVATMANSADKIRDLLTQQQTQSQVPAFLAGLRAKANINIYDDNLKDALPPAMPPAAGGAASAAPASAAPASAAPASAAPASAAPTK